MTRIFVLLALVLVFTACSKWDENRPQPASPHHAEEAATETAAEDDDKASSDTD